MPKVKFGDVVKEVKNKIDRNNNPYEYYVAGDHMDSEDLTIHRRGCFATDAVGPAFIREFRKGQVLYGSRRTYLKKVAVADFDGVTANTTFVLETKDQNVLLQELLPFIMLTDNFTKWSIGKSKGSTNPYILFSDLADYEFDLPTIEEQRKLATVLWKMFRLKEGYVELQHQSDQLVQSQFIEMFGTTKTFADRWELQPIKSCCQIISGYPFNSKLFNEIAEGTPLIRIRDVMRGYTETYTTEITDNTYIIHEGDLLIGMDGDFGISKWKSSPAFLNQRVCKISGNIGVINNEFLLYFLAPWLKEVNEGTMFATVKHISIKQIESAMIPVVDYHIQERFASFVEQLDKSKFVLQETLKYDKISYFSMIKSA